MIPPEERMQMIRDRLEAAMSPDDIQLADESHLHAGHEGAKSGGGHFNLRIVSKAFDGKSLIARHRLVYDAMGETIGREIHALSIQALTPDEL